MFKAIAAFIVSHLLFFAVPVQKKISPLPQTPGNPPIVETTNQKTATSASTKQTLTKQPLTKKGTAVSKKTTTIVKAKPITTTPKAPTNTTASVKTTPASNPAPATTPEPAPDFVQINTDTRKAIVNIFCLSSVGSLSSISGTGVIVSSDGLILTNAHIGQFFLLKDFGGTDTVHCIARTGSPAYPTYNLELVYISPAWVENNKDLLKMQNPLGTGENDYAFLRITSRIDGTEQSSFPFIPMDIRENIIVGEPVLLASYPAGFLGGMSIIHDLNLTSAVTTIANLFTFKTSSIDVLSVPGTVISQKGSSGGAVVDKRTHLIGLISTSSDGKTTSERDLQAITSAYINRDLQATLGVTLAQFIYGDHAGFAKSFANTTAPNLTKLLIDSLSQ